MFKMFVNKSPVGLLVALFAFAADAELRLISRVEWGAQPAKAELTKLTLPVQRVVIVHTAGTPCDDEEHCIQQVRGLQNFQTKTANFDDIAYNFLVGNDGLVYEGRGWEQQGAFARGFNAGSLGVAFIGNYNETAPTEQALAAAQALIEEGVRLGKIDAPYKLLGHRQLIATNSPGEALYALIKQWPQWSRRVNI